MGPFLHCIWRWKAGVNTEDVTLQHINVWKYSSASEHGQWVETWFQSSDFTLLQTGWLSFKMKIKSQHFLEILQQDFNCIIRINQRIARVTIFHSDLDFGPNERYYFDTAVPFVSTWNHCKENGGRLSVLDRVCTALIRQPCPLLLTLSPLIIELQTHLP